MKNKNQGVNKTNTKSKIVTPDPIVETVVVDEVKTEVSAEPAPEPEIKPELSEDQKSEIMAEMVKSGLSYEDLIHEAKRLTSRKEKEVQIGNVRLNKETRKIHSGTEEILLSEKEFGLLNMLFQKKGETISRSEISQEVWKDETTSKFHSIDVSMNHLRSKLEKSGLPKSSIQTVIGKGYLMSIPE